MRQLIDPTTPPAAQPEGGTGWRLVMSEEFNGRPVTSKHGFVTFRPGGPAWRAWYWDEFLTTLGGQNPHVNNPGHELQYYAHGGKTWRSLVPANVWAPGTPGLWIEETE